MNDKFNIVRKNKKDEDDELYEEDFDNEESESKTKPSLNNDLKKRMLIMMGAIVGGTIILLIILYIITLFTPKNYSYSEIEKIMKNAAKTYFRDNSSSLPESDSDEVEIDVANLVAGNYMKDLSEYTKEGVACTGKVIVEKSSDEYLYTPYLDCGENYATEELYKKIVNDDNIVNSGYGLYSRNGSYVFRGEEVNNYVQLDKSLWRIVKVTSNNNIVLINSEGLQMGQPWDDRFNEAKNYNSGINSYNASRIKEYLDKIYTNPSEKYNEKILSKSDKEKILSYNICTGKKPATSSAFDNVEECSEHLNNQRLGLLTISDYVYASIDPNCKTITSKSCQNYNYLAIKSEWWLATADSADTVSVYQVNRSGAVKSTSAGSYATVRPVIYLNNKVLYKSGNGSFEKPYKVR